MAHEFPADIQERLQARLGNGAYQNADEVIRDAMDALDQIEQEKLTRWKERNHLAEEQSAQGLSRPHDEQRLLERLRERLAKEGILD